MPFIPHTPESLIPRSDSKNPATTCKGITNSGRPCRRSLATSPPTSPRRLSSNRTKDGVLAVLSSDEAHEGAAAFFCFQHKNQAVTLQNGNTGGTDGGTRLHTVNERTSIDTLVDRLGVIDILDDGQSQKRKDGRRSRPQASRPVRKDTLPKKWQDVQGPLLALPQSGERPPRSGKRNSQRKPGFLSLLCCMSSHQETYQPPRPRVRPYSEKPIEDPTPSARIPQPRPNSTPPSSARPPLARKDPNRPFPPRDPSSQTQNFLSLIPKDLSPQTTAALLSELAKPVSEHDEEGYIYMFWLTPNEKPSPDGAAISSLLGDSSRPSAKGGRRESSVLAGGGERNKEKTILLKIGRASNVQRRMNEWTRQCGYALTLIRYYPYGPSSSPTPSPLPSPSSRPPTSPKTSQSPGQGSVRKVPHAHRVERLIHLELAEKRVKRTCEAC